MFEALIPWAVSVVSLLALAVVTDPQTVFMRSVSVPAGVAAEGYTAEFVAARLLQDLREIETVVRRRAATQVFALDDDRNVLMAAGATLGATRLVRSLQLASGNLSYAIDITMIDTRGRLQLDVIGDSAIYDDFHLRVEGGTATSTA